MTKVVQRHGASAYLFVPGADPAVAAGKTFCVPVRPLAVPTDTRPL